MQFNRIKTVFLLALMSSLFFLVGHLIGGTNGLAIALVMACLFNFVTYYFSDKMVLAMYRAQPLDKNKYAWIYEIVEELCFQAGLPMPKLWLVPGSTANAFATGRNPAHASVAVTEGILEILDANELRGVLAHEMSHIKNRDILVCTVAATLAAAISYVAQMMQWAMIFGGSSRDRENRGGGLLPALAIIIITPLAATLLQLAISRSREYLADETGAKTCHDPLALASALEKLHGSAQRSHREAASPAEAATASLCIVNPFSMKGVMHLLSTHPPMEERVKRLRAMARGK